MEIDMSSYLSASTLVVGNCALDKKEQDASLARNYYDAFDPD